MTARKKSNARRWAEQAVKRRRPRRPRKRLITRQSVHEATHAVSFVVLDQPFDFVFLRSFKKTFGSILYRRPGDYYERPSNDPIVIEYNEHNLIMTLAAGAAERLFYPHARYFGDYFDLRHAKQIIRKIRHNKKDREAYLDHCRREAHKLVVKNRKKIERVAAALQRWRVLRDYEVSWIVNKPRAFAKYERDWPKVSKEEPPWHDFPGWSRIDRSHYWKEQQKKEREQRERQRAHDAFYDDESGDYWG
jgi:hypothetical protein